MGGTLTCWLAEHHPEIGRHRRGQPADRPPPSRAHRTASGPSWRPGPRSFDGIGSDIAKEGVEEAAYPGTPLAAALSLFEGADEVAAHLGDIRCPTLLLSSRQDHVVDPVSGDVLERSVGGPIERVHLERSYHVATLDWDAPLIEQKVVDFAVRVMGGTGERPRPSDGRARPPDPARRWPTWPRWPAST